MLGSRGISRVIFLVGLFGSLVVIEEGFSRGWRSGGVRGPERRGNDTRSFITVDGRTDSAERRASYRYHTRIDRYAKDILSKPRVTGTRIIVGKGGISYYSRTDGDRHRIRSGDACRRNYRHDHSWRHHRKPTIGIRSKRYCYRDHRPLIVYRRSRPRKYVFISIGGGWPSSCSFARYYWYGCYPSGGSTYYYTTYNYGTSSVDTGYSYSDGGTLQSVDHTTFEDVRQRLAQQKSQLSQSPTQADRLFEEAVKYFEDGDYNAAANTLRKAVELEPDDVVMPFVYAQALFADQQYHKSAEILRDVLEVLVTRNEEGIFYPKGLYSDDEVLDKQIRHLRRRVEIFTLDADLKLLLGYQYIGIGKYDEAEKFLGEAVQDEKNSIAADFLLQLLEKLRSADEDTF